ncbi:MAG: hypothetical protein Q4G58_17515, partial [bacterium]|nr:hypothetical protein [bacterium]
NNQQDYNNQQAFNNQPNSQNGYTSYSTTGNGANVVKAKKSRKWMWGFSAIPALAIVAVLCFFCIPSFQNFVFKKFLGTTKYYEHVESSCSEKVKDEFNNLPKSKKLDPKKGISVDGKMALTLDSTLSEQLGMDLSGFTFDFKGSTKDKKSAVSYVIGYKGTELGTVELCADPANNQMYLKIPTLSDQYIDYSAFMEACTAAYGNTDFSNITSKLNNLSTEADSTNNQQATIQAIFQKLSAELDAETVSGLSTEYIKYILDDIGDKGAIKLLEDEEYKVGSVSKKCDEFIITLTPQQFIDVMKDVLNKAKTDDKILKIVQNVLGDTSAYTKGIEKMISEIENDDTPTDETSNFRMKVYTDGNQIFGRQFSITDKGTCVAIIDYGMLSSNDTTTFNAAITPEDATEQISVTVESKKDGDKSNGTITLTAGGQSVDINFSDCKLNDNGTAEGKYTLTVQSVCNITLDLSANGDTQTIKVGCSALGKELGSLSMDYSAKEASDFSYPEVPAGQVTKITDNKAVAEYLKNSKLESFINTIIKTFNLPATEDAKTLADAIIAEVESGESFNYNDLFNETGGETTPETDQNNASGTTSNQMYKPEDYNLPSGTEIDEYGYYSYDLSDTELAELKKKGSDYKEFDKTYDQFKSYAEMLAKTYCDADATPETVITNNVSGYVTDGYKVSHHYISTTWYSMKDSNYIEVIMDSLNNKILNVNACIADGSKASTIIKDTYSQLGLTAVPDNTMKEIEAFISSKKEGDKDFPLSDSYLSVTMSTYSTGAEYIIRIGKDNTIY